MFVGQFQADWELFVIENLGTKPGRVTKQALTAAQTQMLLKGLPNGLYLYRVMVNEQVVNGKLVVE